jgi:hypothetical protein
MTEPALLLGLHFDLEFIEEHWEALCEMRRPGTPRPWRQAMLDPDQRAAQLDRDREERANRDPDAPGFTSAPEHLDVLDAMVDVWVVLDEIAWRIRRHVVATDLPHLRKRPLVQVQATVRFVRTWIATANEARPDLLDGPAQRLSRLTVEITRVLGLVRAGQLLSGAVCPWCRGVTPKHPAGGATTLRVEEIAPAKRATNLRPAVEGVHAVVCWNPLCTPDDEDCGTRYKGRPAWPWHEWEWLAKRLIIAERAHTAPRPTVPDDFKAQPIEHYGRSGLSGYGEPA